MKGESILVKALVLIMTLLTVAAVFGLSYLCCAGAYWVVCWAFGLTFSWQNAVGVWIISIVLIGPLLQSRRNGNV